MEQIGAIKAELARKQTEAKKKAANSSGLWTTGGTIVGAIAGAIIGGVTTWGIGAGAGATAGASIGAAGGAYLASKR
jgi:uncharacterized protein YcfJ